MLIHGKEVQIDFNKAKEIQQKINHEEDMPETVKQEADKKELKELYANFENNSESLGDMFAQQNNVLLTGNDRNLNRAEYYATFQEMSESNFIHRGLQVIADDACQANTEGDTVKIYSSDEDTKQILEELFHKRLNLNKELWSIIYETCKLGDNFYEIIPDSYEHPTQVSRIRYLNPLKVNRIEQNGKLAFYTYNASSEQLTNNPYQSFFPGSTNEENKQVIYKLEPWQIIHFKIADKDFYPYGGSLLKSGVRSYRRLSLLEDGMVIYRLARVPERRVFRIDIGNLSTAEGMRQINKIKDNNRSSSVMDDKGNINKTAAALSLTQDIYIPVREGQGGTQIETLQGGNGLQNIDDIKYFRDEILWTLNIPSEYLGLSDKGMAGQGSLAMQDIKFARYIERIQFYIVEGLTKIAAIELFFKRKKKEELSNFRIELTNPSNVKEIMDIEYLNQKMSLISNMKGTDMFPTDYILKNVMRMSKKEISDIKFYKSLEAQNAMGGDGGMMGGGMMGGGMDLGGMGGAPMGGDMGGGVPMGGDMGGGGDMAPPPTMSVKTEELTPGTMVKLFGKDVLIENAKDYSKLMKALDEYEKSKTKVEAYIEEDETPSDIIENISEIFNGKEKILINETVSNLYHENELGGLDFSGKTFKIFSKNVKKKPGPKSKKTDLISEELTVRL